MNSSAAAINALLNWYESAKRTLPWRADRDPYHVWVSEIMLQQTRVETVIPYYQRFLAAFPDVRALAEAPDEQLLKLWEGLGYYSRVRNMKKAAQQIESEFGGQFPQDRARLQKLAGIGPYVSGAIASIAFEQPAPAVDGNVLRVVARWTADPDDIAQPAMRRKTEAFVAAHMPAGRCGMFTQALMELGACVCVPNGAPHCTECPLQPDCAAFATGRTRTLPVKSRAKPRKIEERTVLLFQSGEKFALRCRPAKGLLAGLWELPSLDGHWTTEQLAQRYGRILTEPPEPMGHAKHIFTHIEWRMTGFRLTVYDPSALPDAAWFTADEIRTQLSVPTAFAPYMAQIRPKT